MTHDEYSAMLNAKRESIRQLKSYADYWQALADSYRSDQVRAELELNILLGEKDVKDGKPFVTLGYLAELGATSAEPTAQALDEVLESKSECG